MSIREKINFTLNPNPQENSLPFTFQQKLLIENSFNGNKFNLTIKTYGNLISKQSHWVRCAFFSSVYKIRSMISQKLLNMQK